MLGRRPPQPDRAERLALRQARVTAMCESVARGGVRAAVMGGELAQPRPRRKPVRSKALLAAVRLLPCQITGRLDGVQPAHSNWSQHGKGKGQKADDNRVAALHYTLHRELDQGSHLSAEERQELWWRAHVRTVQTLVARGLWPKGVPVPQLEDFWKP